MKAMLIKDFKLMKNQKTFLFLMLFIAIMYTAFFENFSFVIAYTTVAFSTLAVSSISYDTYDNGEAFLFTLPISRKGYVREKYVFGMLMIVISLIFSAVLTFVGVVIRGDKVSVVILVTVAVTFLAASVMLSYMLPIHLKYGADKSKIATLIGVGGILLIGYMLGKLGIMNTFLESAETMVANHTAMAVVLLVFVVAGVLAISCRISEKIMEKKEF